MIAIRDNPDIRNLDDLVSTSEVKVDKLGGKIALLTPKPTARRGEIFDPI
jgi:hypothetical protein